MSNSLALALLDATAQAELVASGEITPLDLVDAAISRIEALNPSLNAVIHERFEQARADAASSSLPRGPFCGVPMVLKDLDGVSIGDPYYAGTRGVRARGYIATHDSYLTAKFRAAGFVIVGRTNTPELGLLPTTEPQSYGPTRNPWNNGHSTGGSSGGSAAAVASGMVPVGHAGDGGGSIRIPASECGLVGLKPTRGRNSLGPEAGEAWGGLVARLAVTRTVRDTAGVLDAVQGAMPGDPYHAPRPARPFLSEVGADPGRLRIGYTIDCPDPAVPVHPECAVAVEHAAQMLGEAGHLVDAAHPTVWDEAGTVSAFTTHFINAFAAWTAAEVASLGAMSGGPLSEDDLEPNTWAVAQMGAAVTAVQYLDAMAEVSRFTRRLAEFWAIDESTAGGYDLLLTPTIPEPPPALGQFDAQPDNPLNGLFRAAAIVPFTAPFNATGQPAISLPVHWTPEGLPVGVQLVAAPNREDLLLRVAAQLEAGTGWCERRPPVFA